MKKIAVVEDNPDNRLLVRVILEPHYEVSEYENGSSALEALAEQKPDLLLVDISLPEMDGVEVLRRIRDNPQFHQLPVIALTAHAMAGDREKYLGLGFDDYVTKPIVDEGVLLSAIQNKVGQADSPMAACSPPGAVETTALERLRKLGGDTFAAEMIDVFLEYTAQKIAQGRRAMEAGDLPGLQEAMHPIKSSAGNVGAANIQELSARIEDLAKTGARESAANLFAQLESDFKAAQVQFQQTRQNLLEK